MPGNEPPAPFRLPTPDQIRNLLAFLPEIENPAEPFATFDPDTSIFDPYIYSALVDRFTQALYENRFIQPFDWPAWHKEAEAYMQDPARLNNADIETLVRLFTIITRKERFCSGTLAGALDDGFILTLLKRLEAIKQTKS